MLNQIARSAISRMNMAPIAVAEHHLMGLQEELTAFLSDDIENLAEQFEVVKDNLCMAYGFGESSSDKVFAFSDGVAIIPIHGMLINRFGGTWGGYITGYNFIRSQTLAAKNDPDVTAVIYDVNSNGGEVAGCSETAEVIASLRGTKPTMAVVDAHCYSAAYWTACAADKVAITPSGGAGSIGAMCMHFDYSKALENSGVQVTLLHAGDHKVDGNPFEPLSDTTRAAKQSDLDEARNSFATDVAKYRGLDLSKVLETEARCYQAKEAKEKGLVDFIADPQTSAEMFLNSDDDIGEHFDDQEFASSDVTNPASQTEETTMGANSENNKPTPASTPATTFTQADIDAARADGATAERTRISGIMSSEVATGREALANHFAFKTTMDVESAVAALTVAPATSAAAPAHQEETAPANPFANAMNQSDNPGIGAGADNVPATDTPANPSGSQANVDSFFVARGLATGRKAAK